MDVFGILVMSGSLPLNELNLRYPGSTKDLSRELTYLQRRHWISFKGDLPDASDIPQATGVAGLTRAGLREALAYK